MLCSGLRHFDEFCGSRWSRDGQLDLVVGHRDLGTEALFVENVGVHLQSRVGIFRDVGAKLSYKLNASRGHEGNFTLCGNRRC